MTALAGPDTADSVDDGDDRSEPYTAVMLVHGIGRPNRNENIGRLIDLIEQATSGPAAPPRGGIFRSFRPRFERHRRVPLRTMAFVSFRRFTERRRKHYDGMKWVPKARYRAYEVHWAPLGKMPASGGLMFRWTIGQLVKAPGALFSNWLRQPRIRRSRIHYLQRLPGKGALPEHDAAALLAHHESYQGLAARRDEAASRPWYRRMASTSLFARYVAAQAPDMVTGARLAEAVEQWARARIPTERRLRILLVGTIAGAAVTILFLTVPILWIAPFFTSIPSLGLFAAVRDDYMRALIALLCLAPPVLIATYGTRFLRTIFSDVRYFASFLEQDRFFEVRRAILDRTKADLEHVLRDPNCARLVIVAHSLGTAIALDTLRELGDEEALADDDDELDMAKISHLFTLGSPIDKVCFLFERNDSRYYRTRQLEDRARGDLSGPPFFERRQKIRWCNAWDPSDPVADPLFTPYGSRVDGGRVITAEIENIEVRNSALLDPIAAHIGYFGNPQVVGRILDAIVYNQDASSFADAAGPEQTRGRIGRLHHAAMIGAAVHYAGFCIAYLLSASYVAKVLGGAAALDILAIIVALVLHRMAAKSPA